MKSKFFEDVELGEKDYKIFEPKMRNWLVLNEEFKKNKLTSIDIKKMIAIELEGQKRHHIVQKLIGRLSRVQKNEIMKQLKDLKEKCEKRK